MTPIPPHKIIFTAPPKDPSLNPPEPSPGLIPPIQSIIKPSETIGSFISPTPNPIPTPPQVTSEFIPPTYTPPQFSTPNTPTYGTRDIASVQNVQNPSMRSFAYDIKSAVDNKGVDMAHIIMSESRKQQARGLTPEDIEDSRKHISIFKIILITLGVIALLGGGVAIFLVYAKSSPVIRTNTGDKFIVSPFVRTERNSVVDLADDYQSTLIAGFDKEKGEEIPPQTLRGIAFKEDSSGLYVDTNRLMILLEALPPETLLRALDPRFSLGLGGSGATSYLILKSTSYDNAYAGMIEWEKTIGRELRSLFYDDLELSSATTTGGRKSTAFADKVYFNIDTRSLVGMNGEPVMMWAILNRTYIVIARDQRIFEEIIKRMTTQNIVR